MQKPDSVSELVSELVSEKMTSREAIASKNELKPILIFQTKYLKASMINLMTSKSCLSPILFFVALFLKIILPVLVSWPITEYIFKDSKYQPWHIGKRQSKYNGMPF